MNRYAAKSQGRVRTGLLLDIDGVLLPFNDMGFRAEFGVRARTIIDHCDVWAWSTAWEEKARTVVGPTLELPDTEALRFPFVKDTDAKAVMRKFGADPQDFASFKIPQMYWWVQNVRVDRLVVIDDDLKYGVPISDAFHVPTLHISPDPDIGLTDRDVENAVAFLRKSSARGQEICTS